MFCRLLTQKAPASSACCKLKVVPKGGMKVACALGTKASKHVPDCLCDAAGLQQGTEAYEAQKAKRGEVLWKAVERVIPDIRERCELSMVSPSRFFEHGCKHHGRF